MTSELLSDKVPMEGRTLVLDQGAVGNLKRIDELLASLWRRNEKDSALPPPVRACMGNLIVYLEREHDRNDITQIMADVMQARPSRVILLFAHPDEPDSPIEVSVSAHCWLEGAAKEQVCSEMIRIKASGAMIHELPGTVVPLLVADVPVHLWWRDRFLARQPLFWKFADHIDHVIYEGLHWKNIPDKVQTVLEISRRLKGKVAITNFNWSRLLPWQLRIAQFFDRGMYGSDLEFLNKVSIEYHTPPEQEEGRFFQALLLCGWLAGQLGWTFQSGRRKGTERHFLFRRKDGQPVEVVLDHETLEGSKTKGIQELKLEFAASDRKSVLSVDRDPENELLFLMVKKEGACGLPQKVRHVSASFATLLVRGMDNYRSSSVVFERAFVTAVALLQAVAK